MNRADQRAGGSNGGQSRRRLAVALLSAALATGAASAALAQDPTDPDTELTPKPKDPTQWALIGGAKHRAGGKPVNEASPTPYTVDFHTTSFSFDFVKDPSNPEGFFGGAECIEDDVPFEDEALKSCERRPALYRFWIDEVGDEHIAKVPTDELVNDPDAEGFVGAVAWIDGNRALAVGGTNKYPRREPSTPAESDIEDGESHDAAYLRKDKSDPVEGAGLARAWLYEDPDGDGSEQKRWREITEELPKDKDRDGAGAEEPMGALTALECAHMNMGSAGQPPVHPKGTCLAGGMQRLWWWNPATDDKDEGFDPDPVTNLEVTTGGAALGLLAGDPTKIPDFHHRVRQIRFNVPYTPGVTAVTSGCCVERAQIAKGSDDLPTGEANAALGGRVIDYTASSGKWTTATVPGTNAVGPAAERELGGAGAPRPESIYSVGGRARFTSDQIEESSGSLVLSPGARPAAGTDEPGSRITGSNGETISGLSALESVRLLAGDGDYAVTKGESADAVSGGGSSSFSAIRSDGGDGTLDWAVGSLKQGSLDHAAQGVAYTTLDPSIFVPPPLTCPLQTYAGGGDCRPDAQNLGEQGLRSKRLLGMGTYGLNSIHFIFGTKNAWAAGDRGALARLGAAGKLGAEVEPEAPRLKPGRSKPLAERAPFEEKRPDSGNPGAVPSRAGQPVETLPKKEIVSYGSADPSRYVSSFVPGDGLPTEVVTSMAMSRDGSEGWALGSGLAGQSPTIQRFDGERWVRCAVDGLGGAHEPDRACTALAGLDKGQGSLLPFDLTTITRIPLEQDSDPSNDDEFEAVAFGMRPADPQGRTSTVLVYRNGVWSIDEAASRVIDTGRQNTFEISVAFQSPSDGWLLARAIDSGTRPVLYHYGGGSWPNGRWVSCTTGSGQVDPAHAEECGGSEAVDLLSTSNLGAQNGSLQVAGDTVFVAGNRAGTGSSDGVGAVGGIYPFVYSKRPDQPWQKEHDPACEEIVLGPTGTRSCRARPSNGTDPLLDEDKGYVFSFSAVELGGGRVAGWLVGRFGLPESGDSGLQGGNDVNRPVRGPKYTLMRRDPDVPVGSEEAWSYRKVEDAAQNFLPLAGGSDIVAEPPRVFSFRGEDGGERAFIGTSGGRVFATHNPPLEFDPEPNRDSVPADRGRWKVMPAPTRSTTDVSGITELLSMGEITAMAPDNQGGVWMVVRGQHLIANQDLGIGRYNDMASENQNFYYRYTNRRPRAVFEDSPSPVSEPITDLDGNREGTVWVSTESERLYRYDRVAGWERVAIPEWDPGRFATRRSKAFAVAVNDQGQGIAVGEQGRIANISSDAVSLDPASVNRCSEAPPPCGTPRNLRSAAVAPDGSALAGGDELTLSWRPAGGQFRLVDPPRSSASARITGLTMPEPGRAWATLDNGEIWGGTLIDPNGQRPWRWIRESTSAAARDERKGHKHFLNGVSRLFDLEVDAEGRGLAVGYRGAMLERSPDGEWKRLVTGYLDNFFSVALPPQGYGDGTVVGGGAGLILTRTGGRFHVARAADHFDPLINETVILFGGRVVGLAVSGGPEDGSTEAWAALQTGFERRVRPSVHALLHYGSEDDLALQPERRAPSLGDAPAEGPGELSLAAFGRSECQTGNCGPFAGNNVFNDLLARRIGEEIAKRKERSAGPVAAVSTGDLNEAPGRDDQEKVDAFFGIHVNQANLAHNQWRQFVADPLLENDILALGALGERDLSRVRLSDQSTGYHDPRELAGAGLTKQWRESFASMPAPWGKQAPFATEAYEYRPVPAGTGAVEHPDVVVEDPTKPVPDQTVEDPTKGTEDPTISDPTNILPDRKQGVPRPGDQKLPPRSEDRKIEGGAHTHYALDVVSKASGEVLSRIVVADTSNLRSLTASDPNQNPAEPQQAWLEQVLCIKGSAADSGSCTREQNTAAVVVTTTPPYSYGAGAVEQTQQEAAAFEALMLRHKVTALITGHMGWNGLYYTFAPSLHFPQPGGEHPDSTRPPTGPGDDRGPDPSDLPIPDAGDITGDNAVTSAFPTVIASSAGGRFGPRGDDSGTASEGYWHGYSLVRVPANGDPTKVIVEQRPILDWINITAKSHVLRPRQKLDLEGIGREPLGVDSEIRINEIDSHAITHCYDLLFADPDKPWLPLKAEDASEEQLAAQGEGCPNRQPTGSQLQSQASEEEGSGESDPCAPYVCLPAQIGTINHQTGDVRAGGGEQERTFGIAVLSVGEQTATWPIAFEPRPSFSPPRVPPPPPPQPPPPPPVPANPPVGTVGNFSLPTPPALPSLPLGAELVPPAPPIPPPPPGAANAAPLNLFLSTPGINIAPQSTVIPPPAPPIQPAPPGGARKEARQRQAAAQKSGSEADTSDSGVDTAEAPPSATGSAMTRLEYTRGAYDPAAPSITMLSHRQQPSAWVTGLQWGGGMTLMALVLAFGWITVRPTPRRRQPEVPAPAYSGVRRR